MSNITIRIEEDLKARSYDVQQKLPFKTMVVSEEDAELIELVKERLKNPRMVSVNLEEL